MEKKICKICDTRHALYNVTLASEENLPICMHCLRLKMASGEVKLKGKDKIEFLERLSASVQKVSATDNPLVVQGKATDNESPQEQKPIFSLQFGHDLTQKARDGKIDPIIGRTKEIESTLRVMKRRFKNNPILLGEPGVGKTAIVEALASRIVKGEVPDNLKNKKIISLSVGNLLAGTKYRGEFEERMKKIIDEAKERDDIILFIDEIHTLTGSGGGDGSMDAGQMLKPALSRGEIQVIGTTTLEEYRKHIEKDAALERRFQKVYISEPTKEESVEIIKGIKSKYEEYHNVIISDEVVVSAVELSEKYISDRMLPDKAIDLIDEACAHKRLANSDADASFTVAQNQLAVMNTEREKVVISRDFVAAKQLSLQENKLQKNLQVKQKTQEQLNTITTDDLAYILNQWTGIPAQKMTKKEIEKLRTFKDDLKNRVKGQDKAIEVLSKSIKRNQVGLKDDNRPVGVFMMLGPTGVGKTELAKALTELLLDDENKMIRFDMSEFMEKHSVSKLIGSPPGYIGYEDEGKLTKAIRNNPYSVVLFDEIEKAHPDITNILLQLFDEGRISNAKGRVIDAKNVIFIMTSNVGSDLYTSKQTSLGYNTTNTEVLEKDLDVKIRQRLKEHYKPEFLNRIDDFLIFNKLTKDVMVEIAHKFVNDLTRKLHKNGVSMKFSKTALDLLADKGYDPENGARPLKRKLDDLSTLIADKIIDGDNVTELSIQVRNGEFVIK